MRYKRRNSKMTPPTDTISIPKIYLDVQEHDRTRIQLNDVHDEFPIPRSRICSKDIPRTYSGLYGEGGENGDLLPFELTRNRSTEWVSSGGFILGITYIIFVCISYVITSSWTATNVLHGFLSIVYLHWIKGSPDMYDQGEMNGMTLWEQLNSNPDTDTIYRFQKQFFFAIPAILSFAGCHCAQYKKMPCAINMIVFLICTLAKMRFMHGVRILGINCTAGIDDYRRKLI